MSSSVGPAQASEGLCSEASQPREDKLHEIAQESV